MASKRVQNCKGTTLRDPKHRALKVLTAGRGRSVEITVVAFYQPSDWVSAFAGRTAKRVKRGQGSCRIDFEHRALKVLTTERRRAVEIAIAALYQPGNRNSTLA